MTTDNQDVTLFRHARSIVSRRTSLLRLGTAGLAALVGPGIANAKNKTKHKNRKKRTKLQQCPPVVDLCPAQVEQCTAAVTAGCAGDAACLARIACCSNLATCDFAGHIACLIGTAG